MLNQHKGEKHAYTYIYYFEIDENSQMVLVVDIVNIGIRWWCIRPLILKQKEQKTPAKAGVFI